MAQPLDSHTLTFYTLSAGLCFCISLVLLGYAHLQRGTILIRSTALAMLMLAVAFFLAGHTEQLPQWMMRVAANMLLLYPSVVLYQGFHAYLHDIAPRFDRLGAGVVASTLPFFVWWGLVVPDGIMRSVVFSLAAAILNGRIAWILATLVRRQQGGIPARIMAALFVIASLWMLGRTGALLLAEPMPIDLQGTNPTTWVTVFWFNVLAAVITATLLAMDQVRHKVQQNAATNQLGIESGRTNLILLWTLVSIISLTILAEVGIAYSVIYQRENQQMQQRARFANQAFVEHTQHVIGISDILIRATRGFMANDVSPADLEQFIRNLNFPRDIIENIYVIGPDGLIVVPEADRLKGRSARERDYFQFHAGRAEDDLHISPVSVGQITGKHQFRLSRRIYAADGRFNGVVLVPLEPEAFSQQYQRMLPTRDAMASLVSTEDRKIRARSPAVENPENYQQPVDNTPLWQALAESAHGSYLNTSPLDGIDRSFHYQRIGDWPLVMVSGISRADVHRNALQGIQPIALGAMLALAVVLTLAFILTGVIRRRDEQENFIAMLGHELKTPLSVIRMTVSGAALAPDSEARIGRAVSEMQNIIERCVQADQLSHGLVSPKFERLDLIELLVKIRENASDPVRVQLDVPPQTTCRSDRQLLGIILANLVDNALKYGQRDGSVSLHVHSVADKGRSGVAVRVSNPPGKVGMPDPDRVFRKYYRAPAAHGKTGSGLGLHISAGFARMLGGRLRYLPDPAEVRFELWLPIDSHPDAVPPTPTFSPPERHESCTSHPRHRRP